TGALVLVDSFDLFKEGKGNAERFARRDKGGYVLREAGPPVTESGIKELAPDPFIRADSFGDLFYIGPARLTDGRDGVNVRDFQSQERVRRVLNELGAIDVGDHDRGEEGLVNLFHECEGPVTLRPDHDSIRLQQIIDRVSL